MFAVPESQSAIVSEKPSPSCAIKALAKKRSFVPNAKPLSLKAPNSDSGMLVVPESQPAIVSWKLLSSCAIKALAKNVGFVPNAKPLSVKAPNSTPVCLRTGVATCCDSGLEIIAFLCSQCFSEEMLICAKSGNSLWFD